MITDKIYTAVSAANDLIAKSVSMSQSKRETILKQGVNAFLLLIILVVYGCLDFATLTFHFEELLTADFWAVVGAKVVAGVCAFNIGINIIWDTELRKDGTLLQAIAEYDDLSSRKQLDFERYVNRVFNPEEKRKAYISVINRRIHTLNRFSKAADRLLYSSDDPTKAETKARNRYCRKRGELEELKTDEYINKNLDSINVRYYEVDPATFELEIDGSPIVRGVKTKGNAALGKGKATGSVVLGVLAVSMFLTAIKLETDKQAFDDKVAETLHYLLKCAGDVAIVLWQVMRGMLNVRKIVSSEFTQPYVGRNTVLKRYLEWRLATNQPESLLHKELNGEVEVELTAEQLAELTAKADNKPDESVAKGE